MSAPPLMADRLSVTGAKVTQINTDQFGGDCHLAAHLIESSARALGCDDLDLLIVENIGNLVCPAEFDIGEDARVVGFKRHRRRRDKPLKYPLMFQVADAAILNKTDLLPYLDFDAALAVENMGKVHPGMPVFELSAKTREGIEPWLSWLRTKVKEKTGIIVQVHPKEQSFLQFGGKNECKRNGICRILVSGLS